MSIRRPVVAGMFYPKKTEDLQKMLLGFIESVDGKKTNTFGIVVPHAGYVYCGKTAASVYSSVKREFETVVILGPNHTGLGVGVATSLDEWETPLGLAKPDIEFVKEITKDSIIMEDSNSHLREHSIETQLPWIQYIFGETKIVPVAMNPIYFDVKTCKDVGEKIFQAAKRLNKKILMVASSDFTHYGSAYGYIPFKSQENLVEKIKAIDMEVVRLINSLEPEKVLRICDEKRLTICGYGPIASMLFAAKGLGAKKGKLVNYSTSFETSKDIAAVVGYAAIKIV